MVENNIDKIDKNEEYKNIKKYIDEEIKKKTYIKTPNIVNAFLGDIVKNRRIANVDEEIFSNFRTGITTVARMYLKKIYENGKELELYRSRNPRIYKVIDSETKMGTVQLVS